LTHLYLILNTFYFSGVKNDQIKRESQGLTEADEYYADNDSEDEGMQVIQKREKNQQKSLRQETTSMPSSGGSHYRRKVISVEVVSNP
jgi:hypothetical protein